MIIAIPTEDGRTVGPVFGRAKCYLIADGASREIVANSGIGAEHGAGTGAAALLAERGVGMVLAPELGPKAAAALASAGISAGKATAGADIEAVLTART